MVHVVRSVLNGKSLLRSGWKKILTWYRRKFHSRTVVSQLVPSHFTESAIRGLNIAAFLVLYHRATGELKLAWRNSRMSQRSSEPQPSAKHLKSVVKFISHIVLSRLRAF
jgi:hypothetical protein